MLMCGVQFQRVVSSMEDPPNSSQPLKRDDGLIDR